MITREGGHIALGIVAGMCATVLTLLSLEVVNLPFGLSDGVLGAVVGGIIAAAVAAATQSLMIIDSVNRADAQELAQKKAACQFVFLKVLGIYDYVRKAHNYYRTYRVESILSAASLTESNELIHRHTFWKPLRSKKDAISFDLTEKKFILDEKDVDLFNAMLDLEGAYRQLIYIEAKYERSYDEFEKNNVVKNLTVVDGKHIQSSGHVHPVTVLELEDLLRHVRLLAISALNKAVEANRLISSILAKKYKQKIEIDGNEDASGAFFEDGQT